MEEGIDPHPTPPHLLVEQSHALDAVVDNGGGLMEVLQRDQRRQAAVMRRFNIVLGVLVVVIVVVIYSQVRIAHNASQIENERHARHVFCIETNFNNSEARVVLVNAFPAASDPALVRRIAADLFPIRDCSKDPPITINTIPVGDLPDPPPTTG